MLACNPFTFRYLGSRIFPASLGGWTCVLLVLAGPVFTFGREVESSPSRKPSPMTLESQAVVTETPGGLPISISPTTNPRVAAANEVVVDATLWQWILIGAGMAALLLVAGIILGVWLSRRDQVAPANAPLNEGSMKLFMDVFQFTKSFAGDVSEFRQFVDGVMKISAAGTGNGTQSAAETARLLAQITQENDHLQRRLSDAEAALKSQADSLVNFLAEARTDGLTRLPNRRAFDDELQKRFAEWRRYNKTFAVLIIDVDHFKRFNDQHGHLAGDSVLTSVAQALREAMRTTDVVARYGGEEFAVVLTNAGFKEAAQAAERARQSIERMRHQYEGQPLQVTASCGVAKVLPKENEMELLKRADVALYASKDAGRNVAHWHDGQRCWRIQGDRLLASASKSRNSSDEPEESPQMRTACQTLSQRLDQLLEEDA